MPSRSRPSRSLFAALPAELKRSIRTQTLDEVDSLAVKQELLLDALGQPAPQSNLLPTQPASPSGSVVSSAAATAPIAVDIVVATAVNAAPTGPAQTYQNIAESSAAAHKRSYDLVESPVTPASRKSDTLGSKKKKSQRPPNKGAVNKHLGHAWDCTGLVPRYASAQQVPLDLRKYFAQRHLLFPLYDSLPLLLDHTGWFSVTPHPIAAHIAERCRCDVIVDAFCGVGGNAIEFARTCERVLAIDNDLTRLRLARHNALQLGVADRIEFIYGDYVDFARSLASWPRREAIDVVFLSPPWGGMDYLNFTTEHEADTNHSSTQQSTYSLGHILPIPGAELFELTLNLTPNIAYYLPRNVDVTELSLLARPLERVEMGENGGREREWVEVEEEWVGEKLKAVTAYFGGLVAEE